MKRILYSPGFGAGWSTWMKDIPMNFSCEYEPIINAIERGQYLKEDSPIILKFIQECKEKFDVERVCVLGLDQLTVAEIEEGERYRTVQSDGNERIEIEGESKIEWY